MLKDGETNVSNFDKSILATKPHILLDWKVTFFTFASRAWMAEMSLIWKSEIFYKKYAWNVPKIFNLEKTILWKKIFHSYSFYSLAMVRLEELTTSLFSPNNTTFSPIFTAKLHYLEQFSSGHTSKYWPDPMLLNFSSTSYYWTTEFKYHDREFLCTSMIFVD